MRDDLTTIPPPVSWGTSRYLEVGGERMRIVERGTSGDLLLLVHGYPSNAQAWRAVMDRLADRYRIAAVDLVGFGWSSRHPMHALHSDAYAERLAGVLDALGWPRAHVAGISWGGGLVLRLAAARPERIDRLALVATVDPSRPLWLGTFGLRIALRAPRLALLTVARAQRAAARAAGVSPDELARGYVEPLRLSGTARFLDRFVREQKGSAPVDIRRISAPTLVIGPLADRVVSPRTTRSVADRVPGASYVGIPGARHAVAAEEPDLVARLIDSFLAGGAAG